uniref:Transposase n=1 Tax=Ascaris lumbricoides TaxID=6252 RepID=A0A0M3HT67_ASCLU
MRSACQDLRYVVFGDDQNTSRADLATVVNLCLPVWFISTLIAYSLPPCVKP